MNDTANNDGEWIKRIDMQDNIAGLPYEIYVVNTEVVHRMAASALPWRSRMWGWAVHAHFDPAECHY